MILPDALFCLGHVNNIEPEINILRVQGEEFTLYRQAKTIDYARSTLLKTLVFLEQNGLLWVYRNGAEKSEIPDFPIFKDAWPSQLIKYDYAAPFKFVMENLYDLNHVGGTHRKTSLSAEFRIENFRAQGLEAEYDLVSILAKRGNTWQENLLLASTKLFGLGDQPLTQHVKLYFPGILVFDDSKAAKRSLRSFSILTIYPVNDTHTKIVACGVVGTNLLFQQILAFLASGRNTAVFAEDKVILENLCADYPRKIRLSTDTPVDYARELYAKYS